MSRWNDQFEAHPFQAVWSGIKGSLEIAKVDDESVLTAVKELARLKKVVQYLDEIITGLDPELVPPATWDSFNSQATACLQQINHYNNNRNINHVTQANAHADNLLTYVRPYEVAKGKAVTAMRNAVKSYAQLIDEYIESFREKASSVVQSTEADSEKAKGILSTLVDVEERVDELNLELFGSDDADGTQERIRELASEINEKYTEITEYYNETLVGDENAPSTKKETLQAKEAILLEQGKIEELLENVEKEVGELEKFHTKIFGKEAEEGKRAGGLSGDLDKLKQALEDFEETQKDRYTALNEEINSLIPGATSAGLATAYKEMKDSFESPIKNASLVFYSSIGLLVLTSIFMAIDTIGGDTLITFVKFQDWSVVLKGLVYKIPFYAPILWLAFYATKRRSEYQRLQQEYAHKEALAKSYNSYKKQIEDLDAKDLVMQKDFIMRTVDAIAYNASATLDGKHGDKMPAQELLDKLVQEIIKSQKSAAKP